jgi:hypothetical protein
MAAVGLADQVVARSLAPENRALDGLRELPLRVVDGDRKKPLAKLLDEYYYGRPRR